MDFKGASAIGGAKLIRQTPVSSVEGASGISPIPLSFDISLLHFTILPGTLTPNTCIITEPGSRCFSGKGGGRDVPEDLGILFEWNHGH